MQIAASSCALGHIPFSDMEKMALAQDWTIEFSSGFRYEPNLETRFIESRCKRWIHNYFPPPQTPFVLNLASAKPATRQTSIDHGRQALRMAHEAGIPFYSIHAGFCIEPDPKDLGRPLSHYAPEGSLEKYWERFLDALRILLTDAERYNIHLYVENNVVSQDNVNVPLLCSDAAACLRLFKDLPHPRLGLLLDTAHLKVSAQSLRFSADDFVLKLKDHVKLLHHSDNDGKRDTNLPLDRQYWFLKHMPSFADRYHVLEINDLSVEQINTHIKLLTEAVSQPAAEKSKC